MGAMLVWMSFGDALEERVVREDRRVDVSRAPVEAL